MPPKSRHGNRGKVIQDRKSDMDTREAHCVVRNRSNDQSNARCHGSSDVQEEVAHGLARVDVDGLLASKKDYFDLLPKEVVMFMLGYLEPGDLLKTAQTSKIWRKLAEDNLLWKNKCEKARLGYCLNSQNEETLKRWSKNSSFMYSVWKASFLKPYRIEKNFRTKKPKVIKVEKCHFVEGEYLRLSVQGNMIVSSSSNAMYVSCALTGKTLHTLVGHTGPVNSIEMNNDLIISGSLDRSIRVWNIDTGESVHVLRGHTGVVRCLHLHGGIVVSGSWDTTLRMWDVQGGHLLRTMTGHQKEVRCVQYTGNLVVSGSIDRMVKVWDPETGECLRTLSGHTRWICSLKVDGGHVVSSTIATIKIWEVNTGVLKYTLSNYGGNNFEVHDDVLVAIDNSECKCKIWNIISWTASSLRTLDGHSNAITDIQFNDKFVVTATGPYNGKVKLWDVKTGDFIRDLYRLESGGKVWKIWLEDAKIVCAVQLLRMDNLKKLEFFVLNLDMNDVK